MKNLLKILSQIRTTNALNSEKVMFFDDRSKFYYFRHSLRKAIKEIYHELKGKRDYLDPRKPFSD